MPSYAVIGASRGIGLEYVRQLAGSPDNDVFAVVRNAANSSDLQGVANVQKNVHVLEADVVDYRSLENAAGLVSEKTGGTLDFLIHNAARMNVDTVFKGFDDFASMDELDADFIDAYKVNALGVIHGISVFLPLLRAGRTKKIVVIGSAAGDSKFVRTFGLGDMAAYGMTKAAALIVTTKWAVKLQDEGFVVVTMSPGLVDTSETADSKDPASQAASVQTTDSLVAKGAARGMQTPQESVTAQLKVIDGLKPSDNGLFLAHTGGERL